MQRRTLLTNSGVLLASSLSGCLAAGPWGESPNNRIEDVVTDSASDLPLVPSISIGTAEATEDRPLSIVVSWVNEQQETARFGEERSVMFHAARSENEQVHLLSDDYGTWDDVVSLGECWYVSGEIGGDGAYRVRELKPGEAHETELKLYAASADCFTTDSYRFQTLVSVGKSGERPEDRRAEEWGFVLHVESAEG